MTQLSLFAAPASAQPVAVDSRWQLNRVRPGSTMRQVRVKSCDGLSAIVVPVNFVDDAWPWTGRAITVAQLLNDWAQIQRNRS